MKNLLILCLLAFSFQAQAQSERFKKKKDQPEQEQKKEEPQERSGAPKVKQPETVWDRLVYGGGAGLSFGTNTNIFLAPQVGYRVSDNFIAGLGYMYSYTRWTQILTFNGWVDVNFENQIHGPNLFATFTLWEKIFAGAQGELLNHDAYLYRPTLGTFEVENRWTPVLFIQGGFYQPVGKKGFMQIGLRLNLLHDEFSPYATSWSPVFQYFF